MKTHETYSETADPFALARTRLARLDAALERMGSPRAPKTRLDRAIVDKSTLPLKNPAAVTSQTP